MKISDKIIISFDWNVPRGRRELILEGIKSLMKMNDIDKDHYIISEESIPFNK